MLFDYKLTEEECSLNLSELKLPDPFRVAALNFYRDIARGVLKWNVNSLFFGWKISRQFKIAKQYRVYSLATLIRNSSLGIIRGVVCQVSLSRPWKSPDGRFAVREDPRGVEVGYACLSGCWTKLLLQFIRPILLRAPTSPCTTPHRSEPPHVQRFSTRCWKPPSARTGDWIGTQTRWDSSGSALDWPRGEFQGATIIGLTGALAPTEIVCSGLGLELAVPDSGPVFPELEAFSFPVFGSSETGSLFSCWFHLVLHDLNLRWPFFLLKGQKHWSVKTYFPSSRPN